jgi:DNA processing protein
MERPVKDVYHWVALSLAPGVGSVLFRRLAQTFGSPERVFMASPAKLARVEGIGPKVVESLRRFDWKPRVEKELRTVEKIGARLVTWEDEEYPANLKNIYDPPPLLYINVDRHLKIANLKSLIDNEG